MSIYTCVYAPYSGASLLPGPGTWALPGASLPQQQVAWLSLQTASPADVLEWPQRWFPSLTVVCVWNPDAGHTWPPRPLSPSAISEESRLLHLRSLKGEHSVGVDVSQRFTGDEEWTTKAAWSFANGPAKVTVGAVTGAACQSSSPVQFSGPSPSCVVSTKALQCDLL